MKPTHSPINRYDIEQQKILQSYFRDIYIILAQKTPAETPNPLEFNEIINNIRDKSLQTLSFDDYLCLLAELSKNPDMVGFGLEAGKVKTVKNFGIYGYALMSCNSYKQFIAVANRIFNAIYEPLNITHEVVDSMLHMSFLPIYPIRTEAYIPFMEQVMLCGVALKSAKLPSSIRWEDCSLHCNYSPPPYAHLYQNYFAGKIYFDEPVTQMRVPAWWLDIDFDTSDNFIFNQCETQITRILTALDSQNDLVGQIRQILLRNGLNPPTSITKVARDLLMSERTLRHHLAQQNTSYRQILNDIRIELAKHYLRESNLEIQEISFSLGYQHVQNFYRAFSKQSLTTPEKYRKHPYESSVLA